MSSRTQDSKNKICSSLGSCLAWMSKPTISRTPAMLEIKNCDYLLDKTGKVLHRLVETAPFLSNYAFVGGSAVALHLRHRLSEDLDFMCVPMRVPADWC